MRCRVPTWKFSSTSASIIRKGSWFRSFVKTQAVPGFPRSAGADPMSARHPGETFITLRHLGGPGAGKGARTQRGVGRGMKRLEGKNVLITGGSTGIGRATAIRFADEGANVAINYHSSAREAEITLAEAQKTCSIIREKGCGEMLVQGDVASEEDVKRIFAEVLGAWGRLDILVNNAGIQVKSPTHETTMGAYDRVLAVNLRGAFLCAREAVRHFLDRGGGGVILNNTSIHETVPKPYYASYAVSKAGIRALGRILALEYAGQGIRVNTVAPGAVVTPINREWADDPAKRALVEAHIPMGRAGDPEEIAGVFAFLASDEAAYITGQTIYVDGGLTLYADFRTPWSSGS